MTYTISENAQTAVADTLDDLAQLELAEVEQFIANVPPTECAVFLIEACRCLDHIHVVQFLSNKEEAKLSIQDFDILVRGWNVLFAILMRRNAEFSGIPLRTSVPELRQAVVGMLHCAGRYVLLNRTAEMVRHQMVSAKADGDEIKLSLSERTLTDHFHDQVDHRKFAELNGKALQKYRSIALDGQASRRMRVMMGKLTFPWQTSQGVMVGYTADPEIDAYFLGAVTEDTLQWRDDAGIHPSQPG